MDIEHVDDDEAVLRLGRDELAVIANALNYVCNAIDLPEFPTLFGVDREEADVLLAEIVTALQRMNTDDRRR